MDNTRIILLHGAGLGAWIWRKAEPMFHLPATAVSFPNRDSYKADHRLTLDDYCESILREISSIPEQRLILVAHSISSLVACRISPALESRLVGFAGIAAVIPRNGGSFLSTLPFMQRAMTWGALSLGGTRPPDSMITKSYCNDLTREETDMVLTKYVPESMMLYSQPCDHMLPADLPKLYVKFERDKSISPELQQKMITNLAADRVTEIQAGHLGMLSEPRQVAHAVNTFFEQQPKSQPKKARDPVYR